ncbi:hypothetical protein [Paracoccus beibuensis]|uniref:hypothetical protein n=1 Tax=Paracoccus beibuensis TaxID=547602 RepID=UPI00223FC244|nr:hypothetical protein [Paracoccus beibuensis]
MQIRHILTTATILVATALAPALADPGRGKGNHEGRGHAGHCPPGLAKKSPACVPPGHARQDERRYGNRTGEVLRIGDYVVIRDPARYDLERRDGWNYYRDDNNIYRVDRDTQRVLAVLNLVRAFTN